MLSGFKIDGLNTNYEIYFLTPRIKSLIFARWAD